MKIRLQYLAPYVDRFFVCEQRYTHQGTKKETLFLDLYADWFAPYKEKVVRLVDEAPPSSDSWVNENRHRNYVMPWLFAEGGDWLCSVCDVDELPDCAIVKAEQDRLFTQCAQGPVYLQQMKLYYNLQWFVDVWRWPFFISSTLVGKLDSLQQCRTKQFPQFGGLLQCGWHLSYCMSAKEIQRKLQSFAHVEHNTADVTNPAHIQSCIERGIDLFKRYPQPFQKVPLSMFPAVLQDFHHQLLSTQCITSREQTTQDCVQSK